MKLILTIFVATVLLASVAIASSAIDVSTIGKITNTPTGALTLTDHGADLTLQLHNDSWTPTPFVEPLL